MNNEQNNYENSLKETICHKIEEEKESLLDFFENKESYEIPFFIEDNLKFKLRDYQIKALENFILLNNKNNEDKIKKRIDKILQSFNSSNNHFLFHMATGSGKTMIMASTILYLKYLGYSKFIFTASKTTLITKTKENLIPKYNSNKCEFKNNYLEINGEKIYIKEINENDSFSSSNNLEIMFTTINNLHNKINEVKEKSINLNNLSKFKEGIVILGDEAHNFQVNTKSNNKLNNKLNEEDLNWENTIQNILNLNKKNLLIEFTATIGLTNKKTFDKYKNKLIYNYTLKEFRKDGYSKEINLIKDEDKYNKILHSILMSQYRYCVGMDNKIPLVPKILFKSTGKIENLENEKKYVLNLISNISINNIDQFLNNKNYENLESIQNIKKYLNKNDKNKFLLLLKRQFGENSVLIIHTNDKEKEKKLKIANNLDKNEKIRMIFAINMLNEGWDVLSLFDIVKIDEISNNKKESTTQEIQLIGRGARIFPFNYFDGIEELDKFKRKFDKFPKLDLRNLEEMNFYSSNENNFINNLKKDLIELGYKDENEEKKIYIKINPQEERTEFSNIMFDKFVFSNTQEKTISKNTKIQEIEDIKIQIIKDFSKEENQVFKENEEKKINNYKEITKNIKEFIELGNKFILNYELNKLSYFNINNISSKFNIKSKEDLVNNIIGLKDKIIITIKSPNLEEINFENINFENINFENKSNIISEILDKLIKKLEQKKLQKFGSKNFKNKYSIKETFKEYSKNEKDVNFFNKTIKFKGYNGELKEKNYILENKNLFYYDSISSDSGLELDMYNLFDKNLDSSKFLVIRNEVGFKLYNPFTKKIDKNNNEKFITDDQSIIEKNNHGFEPDFILLEKGKEENQFFQYFIEVKNSTNATNNDEKWKEELLKEINNFEILVENDKYNIYGTKFFTEKSINYLKNEKII